MGVTAAKHTKTAQLGLQAEKREAGTKEPRPQRKMRKEGLHLRV